MNTKNADCLANKERRDEIWKARKQNKKGEKEYEKADQIREELLNMGITIKDTREGTIYEKNNS